MPQTITSSVNRVELHSAHCVSSEQDFLGKRRVWLCRQMAAGDHLRVLYEQLSKDPNSLANLDQDLPNYAQHQVPIFSLPQVCHY